MSEKSKKQIEDFKILKKFDLLSMLHDSILKEVAKEMEVLTFNEGEIICHEDTDSHSMYFINKGSVMITKKGVPLNSLKVNEYFGEMSLLEGRQRTATVTAIEECETFEISMDVFEQYLRNSADAMNAMIITFDKRLRAQNSLVLKQFLELKQQYVELQETHDRLLQTEKLASIGSLTAGIAHEINNPLTVITGYVDIIKKKLDDKGGSDEFFDKAFDRLKNASNAIKEIILGLKTYVRMDTKEDRKIKLNETVQSSIDLVAYLYKKEGISIETNFDTEELFVFGNVGKLQQVIMNMLSNAKDALKGRDDKKIKIFAMLDKESVVIEFSDTGCGIPKDKVGSIFDKFYTTKPVGEGTGLGLDITLEIIQEMNGEIKVESVEGVGTTFRMIFPKA